MKNRVMGFFALITAPMLLIAVSGLINPSFSEEPQGGSASGDEKQTGGAAKVPKLDVAFKDTALTLTVDSGKTATGTLFLQNTGEVPAEVAFTVVLAKGAAKASIHGGDNRIEPNEIKAFPLSIAIEEGTPPLSGYLIMEMSSTVPGPKKKVSPLAIKLNPPPPPPPSPYLVLYPLAAAALLTISSFLFLYFKKPVSPLDKMGSPTWSFKDSWASNITVASGALTTMLTFSSLPDQPVHFTKSGYAVLSFLFAALIGLAPIIYNLLRKEIEAKNESGQTVVQFQGFVIFFLLASLLTLWGVIGQLTTLVFNLDEIWKAGLIVKSIIRLFQGLLILAGVVLLGYAFFSIKRTIERQKVVEKKTRQRAAAEAAVGAPPADVRPALPDWPLL